MSYEIKVEGSRGTYSINLGSDILGAKMDENFLVFDPAVESFLPPHAQKRIAVVGSENSKTLSGCENVLIKLNELGLNRTGHVFAIGGGSIQDVATLVSALYMRGVGWTFAPTTLMAMVDSCVGGKSSINVGGVKNLVGNFYPPDHVIIDTRFIATLPP